MLAYAPQRQILPLINSFTAASSGPHGSLSNATPDMIWPEVQYPHWYPSQPTNAACMGCNASGVPRPSMVVISSPSCIKARLRHEFTRLPFTCTVHAPHCPWSQPFLVPVRATVSRTQSSSVVRGSMRSWWSLPLMRSVIGTAPSMLGPPAAAAAELCSVVPVASPGTYAAITEAAAVVPVVLRNVRRVGLDGPDFGSSSGMGASVQNWSEKLIEAERNLSTPIACTRDGQYRPLNTPGFISYADLLRSAAALSSSSYLNGPNIGCTGWFLRSHSTV